MTALCAGGTSGVKPGQAAVLDLTASLAGQLLGLVESPWLIPIIALLDLAPLTLSTFCATDPPAMVALTLAESTALLTYAIGTTNFNSGIIKAANNVLNGAWASFCQCTSTGAIAPPVAPAAPAGTAIYTPPIQQGTAPCKDNGLFAQGGISGSTTNIDALSDSIPPGATSYEVYTTAALFSGAGDRFFYKMHEQLNGVQTFTDTTTIMPASGNGSFIGTIRNPNSQFLNGDVFGDGDPGTSTFSNGLRFFCNGQTPGGVSSPCCPPDAATQGTLDAILAMVTLLQRQSTPFAYIVSTAHTLLSGNAQFAVQGLIGLAIAITTLPTRAGVQAGDPNTLWDVGWIDVGTADGWFSRTFLKTNPQVVFPPDMGAVTLVGYSIPADVVVTITELVREP